MTGQAGQDQAAQASAPGRARLPSELLDLLDQPSLCFLATAMPDGSPQLTQVWVGTDGEHILINAVGNSQKVRNVARDPRVAVNICVRDEPRRYWAVRGRVVAMTADGASGHIDTLSQKYLGCSYPGFAGGREDRVLLIIVADTVTRPIDRRPAAAQTDTPG